MSNSRSTGHRRGSRSPYPANSGSVSIGKASPFPRLINRNTAAERPRQMEILLDFKADASLFANKLHLQRRAGCSISEYGGASGSAVALF
jgi:hypothetical protein